MDQQRADAPDRLKRELHALTEIAKTLTQSLELPELLNQVIKKIVGVLQPAELGVVMLWDQSSGLFRPVATYGFKQEELRKIGLRSGESITGKVYDSGKAWLLDSPEKVASAMADMRTANRDVFSRSVGSDRLPICTIAAPISVGKLKYGVLVLETIQGPAVFEENDFPFVQSICDLIGLAIDRSRLEAKADAVREAREAEHLRSELMATLSHELRLPLTSIKGYSTALLIDELHWDSEQREDFLRLIDEECDNMHIMIKDILDSSLVDFNQINLACEPVRIQHLATEVASEIQRRTDAHRLLVDFTSPLPVVLADPHWMKQVLRNIIDNAIKYSPDGGLVVIRADARPADIVVSIADQGIGISPEDLIPLFEKFFRVKTASGYHIPGTGLGLPVARAIIEAHGGRIWVESKVGLGTSVYFTLPRLQVSQDEEP